MFKNLKIFTGSSRSQIFFKIGVLKVFAKSLLNCVFLWNLRNFEEHCFLQNISGGYFWIFQTFLNLEEVMQSSSSSNMRAITFSDSLPTFWRVDGWVSLLVVFFSAKSSSNCLYYRILPLPHRMDHLTKIMSAFSSTFSSLDEEYFATKARRSFAIVSSLKLPSRTESLLRHEPTYKFLIESEKKLWISLPKTKP